MIRNATLVDVERLHELLNSHPDLKTSEGKELTVEFIKACITNDVNYCLVSEENGIVAGVLIGELWKDKKLSYVDYLIVDEKFRKAGIASKLLSYVEEMSKKEGCNIVNVFVKTTNINMQGCVEKKGFEKGYAFYYYEKKI